MSCSFASQSARYDSRTLAYYYYYLADLSSRSIPAIKSRLVKFSLLNMFIQFDEEYSSMLITLESYHTQRGKHCLKIVNLPRRKGRFVGYW